MSATLTPYRLSGARATGAGFYRLKINGTPIDVSLADSKPIGGPLTHSRVTDCLVLLKEHEVKILTAALNRIAARESPASLALQLRNLAQMAESNG